MRRRAVVTGGAGFVGSHVCERLLGEGWEVLCLDSLLTGDTGNLEGALRSDRFFFVTGDVTERLPVTGHVDAVLHLASPASPVDYLAHPLETLQVGAVGTHLALELARTKRALFLLASTSEVYGDPLIHPQPESYWGNVNPVGPRSVYDEAKRYAEALSTAYERRYRLPIRIARIFNTYGPRMRQNDGRAVPMFIAQALRAEPLTVHGDGMQTRSLCYVEDLVDGIYRLLRSDHVGPMNIGNPSEVTILDLAELVRSTAGSASEVIFTPRPVDDPQVRCPDITLAKRKLRWEPKIALEQGLATTVDWASETWGLNRKPTQAVVGP